MIRSETTLRVVERTAKRIRFREDARIAGSIVWVGAALLCLAAPFLVPSSMAANAARLWTITVFVLPVGLNRLLGTTSTFDLNAGTVCVCRTLGSFTIFRRTFGMDDVVRVFHDRREYLRIKVQNPRLEMVSGKRVNLSQWCPTKLDLESDVAAANRLLHRWKESQPATTRPPESFPKAYAEACPTEWTPEGLNALTQTSKARSILWAKRSGMGFGIGVACIVLAGPFLPGALRVVIGVASMAFLMAAVVFSAFLMFDWMATKRE